MKRTQEDEFVEIDDNRQIADMNVEGMPWYVDKSRSFSSNGENKPPLSRMETFKLILQSMLAALLIGGVIIFAMFLFILFCTNIWFQ